MSDLFKNVAANENNPKWQNMIKREKELYSRNNDIRSEFERDYTRIIHSNAYKRMKHKTQVFFSPENDHICTRIEHVTHVESISYTIANYLGLNTELTKAIATAHDIGHSPFGHQGERILSEISKRDIGVGFWHEKNGVITVDKIELLPDNFGNMQNLNLTYAVRDGIISHCGEIDENNLKPREEAINLDDYVAPNQYAPYTWEGCVVKISDKISYLGRDIQDAITLGILDENLEELANLFDNNPNEKVNNTVIINNLIYDLCQNSSPENGLCFSDKGFKLINKLKEFNYKKIYLNDRLKPSNDYFKLVINQIYNTIKSVFDGKNTLNKLEQMEKIYPKLISNFKEWLSNYWTLQRFDNFKNYELFDIANEKDFCTSIILYIAGMTDNFAIETYNYIVDF
ncbi:MAG: HD domain-containing protein [Clostridia bacterium]|nr:HD domain-containing protein [Clostridia bacterium]